MNCEDCCELLGPVLDGEIDELGRRAVLDHLAHCPLCRGTWDQLQQLDSRLSSLRTTVLAPAVESLRGPIMDQPMKAATSQSRVRNQLSGILPRAAMLAAAAVVLLVLWPWQLPQFHREVVRQSVVPVAQLTRSTGQVEIRKVGRSDWQKLSAASASILSGDRLRTPPSVACEVITAANTRLRMNEEAELRILSGNHIECLAGQVWCRVEAAPAHFAIPAAVSSAPGPTKSLSSSAESSLQRFTCPSPTEVQWSIDVDRSACVATGEVAAVLRGAELTCEIPPGAGLEITEHGVDAASVVRTAIPVQELLWQLPLLSIGEGTDAELVDVVEAALAQIGQAKMSYLVERQIRSLGPAGSVALLAYVQSDRSHSDPSARLRAMQLACETAEQSSLDRLQALAADPDPEVASLASSTLKRLRS